VEETPARLLERLDDLVAAILRAAEPFEFATFLLGSRLPPSLEPEAAREIKRALHAALASALASRWPARRPDLDAPEVRLVVDVLGCSAEVQATPVWLAGRYRKLDREMPQSRWPCRRCKGRGCPRCGGTGRIYPESVEEAIGAFTLAALEGAGTRFHAVGREDIDARMLGDGRPFVLEVIEPRRRSADLVAIERAVNDAYRGRVEFRNLRRAAEADAQIAKALECEKSYRAAVCAARPLDPRDAARVSELSGVELSQSTPSRVLHRRADSSRRRRVFRAEARALRGGLLDARFRVQSGTYVKELVCGDGGRTQPSVASLLGCPCRVLVLDVLAVHDEPVEVT
jgi:tRNA pseudouridine synthase 10